MNPVSSKPGPFFFAEKPQDHPGSKVHDLGIVMKWGTPAHVARLYRKLSPSAAEVFTFDHVLIHEDDAPGEFDYQPSLACNTRVGTFYPLSAYLLYLYISGEVERNIFSVLVELDQVLPREWPFVIQAGNIKALPRMYRKLLAENLETQRFCIARRIPEEGRVLLDIGWLTRPEGWLSTPEGRAFFTGILELRLTKEGFAGQWMLPGQCGINHLLRREFEQLCPRPGDCLSRKGRVQFTAGLNGPLERQMDAKHVNEWPEQSFQSMFDAMSSSKRCRTPR